MSEHTVTKPVSGRWQSIITCEGVVFATITGTTEEACTAAARMLVAGHKMLSALCSVAKWCASPSDSRTTSDIEDEVFAAIAAATRGQP